MEGSVVVSRSAGTQPRRVSVVVRGSERAAVRKAASGAAAVAPERRINHAVPRRQELLQEGKFFFPLRSASRRNGGIRDRLRRGKQEDYR